MDLLTERCFHVCNLSLLLFCDQLATSRGIDMNSNKVVDKGSLISILEKQDAEIERKIDLMSLKDEDSESTSAGLIV